MAEEFYLIQKNGLVFYRTKSPTIAADKYANYPLNQPFVVERITHSNSEILAYNTQQNGNNIRVAYLEQLDEFSIRLLQLSHQQDTLLAPAFDVNTSINRPIPEYMDRTKPLPDSVRSANLSPTPATGTETAPDTALVDSKPTSANQGLGEKVSPDQINLDAFKFDPQELVRKQSELSKQDADRENAADTLVPPPEDANPGQATDELRAIQERFLLAKIHDGQLTQSLQSMSQEQREKAITRLSTMQTDLKNGELLTRYPHLPSTFEVETVIGEIQAVLDNIISLDRIIDSFADEQDYNSRLAEHDLSYDQSPDPNSLESTDLGEDIDPINPHLQTLNDLPDSEPVVETTKKIDPHQVHRVPLPQYRQEQWLLGMVATNGLASVIQPPAAVGSERLDKLDAMLATMLPLGVENTFWSRHFESFMESGLTIVQMSQQVEAARATIQTLRDFQSQTFDKYQSMNPDASGTAFNDQPAFRQFQQAEWDARNSPNQQQGTELPNENPTDTLNGFDGLPLDDERFTRDSEPELLETESVGAIRAEGQKKRALPPDLAKNYILTGGRLFERDGDGRALAVDDGDTLRATSSDEQTIKLIAAIIQDRGWKNAELSGDDKFKAGMWLELSARGVDVTGYEPTAEDKLALQERAGLASHEIEAIQSVLSQVENDPAITPENRELTRLLITNELIGTRAAAGKVLESQPGYLKLQTPFGDREYRGDGLNKTPLDTEVVLLGRGYQVTTSRVLWEIQNPEQTTLKDINDATEAQYKSELAQRKGFTLSENIIDVRYDSTNDIEIPTLGYHPAEPAELEDETPSMTV